MKLNSMNTKKLLQKFLYEEGEVNDLELDFVTKGGEKRSCMFSLIAPVASTAELSYQGLIHDITNLKKAEKANLQVEKLGATGRLVRTLAHEELGLSEESFPNPWVAAVAATVSTAIGAFIPIIPFFFMQGIAAVIAAALISLLAHFAVGAAKTLVTGRSWVASGMEMTVVGAIEAVITYTLGAAFRVA